MVSSQIHIRRRHSSLNMLTPMEFEELHRKESSQLDSHSEWTELGVRYRPMKGSGQNYLGRNTRNLATASILLPSQNPFTV
jgi:hypothetical protein